MLGWEFPPVVSGGLGTACHGLFSALRREGISVLFVVPWAVEGATSDVPDLVAALGTIPPGGAPAGSIRVNCMSSYAFGHHGTPYGESLREEVDRFAEIARRIVRQQAFDVVHAHDWMTCRAGVSAREALDRPLVAHFHSIEHDRAPGNPNHQICALEKEGLVAADRVVAVSRYTRERIAKCYRVDPGRVTVVPNGTDETVPLSLGHRPNESSPKTALFVGRLTAQKGPQYFLLAAEKVLRSAPETRFIVVGDGDMRGYLQDMARDLRIADRVLFTGFLTRFDLDRVYGLASVCVLTSVSEPFGLVALEAMKRGIPVIVPTGAGVTEVVRRCVLVDYWDVDGIAGAILDVLNNRDRLADELAVNGAREARKLTWKRAARKLVGVYEEMASQTGR